MSESEIALKRSNKQDIKKEKAERNLVGKRLNQPHNLKNDGAAKRIGNNNNLPISSGREKNTSDGDCR